MPNCGNRSVTCGRQAAVLIDQCQALDQLWLLRTGGLGMRLAADVFTQNQVKLCAGGRLFGC